MRKESIVVFVIIILYIDSDFDGRTLFDDDAIADVFFFLFFFQKNGPKRKWPRTAMRKYASMQEWKVEHNHDRFFFQLNSIESSMSWVRLSIYMIFYKISISEMKEIIPGKIRRVTSPHLPPLQIVLKATVNRWNHITMRSRSGNTSMFALLFCSHPHNTKVHQSRCNVIIPPLFANRYAQICIYCCITRRIQKK